MATHELSGTATATQEVIDLTGDGGVAVDNFPFPLVHLPVLPGPGSRPLEHPSLAALSRDSKTISSSSNVTTPRLVARPGPEGHSRPTKRRRIIVELASPEPSDENSQRRERVAAALGKCLEEQVFPHIERATETLPSDIYDLDRLGATVIRTVVDKEFERHYDEGGGRLSASAELAIAAGVRTLVTQFASGPDYLHAPPKPPVVPDPESASVPAATPAPMVLPSIEKDVDVNGDGDRDGEKGAVDLDTASGASEYFDGLANGNKPAAHPIKREDSSPPSPKGQDEEEKLLSLHELRSRAKASRWQSGKSSTAVFPASTRPRSFGLPIRPYASAPVRQQIASGVESIVLPPQFQSSLDSQPSSQVFHVDFSYAEIHYLRQLARTLYGKPVADGTRTTLRDLRNILKKAPKMKASIVRVHSTGYLGHEPPPVSLTKRSSIDIINFLNDLYSRRLNAIPQSLFVEYADPVAKSEAIRANVLPSLLLSREITGRRLGTARSYQNFTASVKSNREDHLEPQVEWTNCAGDIMTVSWLSDTDFVCGTTTHSDSRNQQYNKPGNLLLGSIVSNTLQAYPDHRIVRPVVESGENALDSMVASQDPWLYTSVVSSDYDATCGLGFTSGFDNTVKTWKLENGSMKALGTWKHEGRVNFVVASKNGTGTIATAADVSANAVRVYHLDKSNIPGSPYESYSCARVHDEDYVPSDKWAYFPAAIRWGRAPEVTHLLLVGYSPRSISGDDDGEIPEDKVNSGELCLWDTITRTQIKVNTAKTQNVFELAWHPTGSSFAACTSATLRASIEGNEATIQYAKTQVRIFEMNKETRQYVAIKTLDCPAIDINELSIMPNSMLYSYVAAAATNGKVYVWDTAGSDVPMCVLEHGAPVEELLGERDREDVGVKFAEWATTADRLYTGSSDGVVKVWNIRQGTLVKDLIEAAGPITCGTFSPDHTKLVIGDGSGRVYLLGLENPEDEDLPPAPANSSDFLNVQTNGGKRAIRRPRPFLPHPEPPPPGAELFEMPVNSLMEGQKTANYYLNSAQLVLHPDPTVGVVQGRNYAQTGLYRAEAHINEAPHEPLLPSFESQQQGFQRLERQARRRTWLRRPFSTKQNGQKENSSADQPSLSILPLQSEEVADNLDPATLLELTAERAEIDDRLFDFDYETSIYDSDEDNNEEEDAEGDVDVDVVMG